MENQQYTLGCTSLNVNLAPLALSHNTSPVGFWSQAESAGLTWISPRDCLVANLELASHTQRITLLSFLGGILSHECKRHSEDNPLQFTIFSTPMWCTPVTPTTWTWKYRTLVFNSQLTWSWNSVSESCSRSKGCVSESSGSDWLRVCTCLLCMSRV